VRGGSCLSGWSDVPAGWERLRCLRLRPKSHWSDRDASERDAASPRPSIDRAPDKPHRALTAPGPNHISRIFFADVTAPCGTLQASGHLVGLGLHKAGLR
jgi:hypothetical protein